MHVSCYPSSLTMMFSHIVENGCYIYINVSEIHSGNCGKFTAHAWNIILTLIELGCFRHVQVGGGASSPFYIRC